MSPILVFIVTITGFVVGIVVGVIEAEVCAVGEAVFVITLVGAVVTIVVGAVVLGTNAVVLPQLLNKSVKLIALKREIFDIGLKG